MWNVVLWCIGDRKRVRPARVGDVREGLPFLIAGFLALLHQMRAVVLIGAKAARAEARIRPRHPGLKFFHYPCHLLSGAVI